MTTDTLSADAREGLARMRRWLPQGMSLSYGDWNRRHRWMLLLLWAHAVGLPLFALHQNFPVSHALLEGGIVAALALAATLVPGRRIRSMLGALGLITCSALLVHISGGYIEAHFHFFVVIVVLTLYEDWVPFLLAFAYVIVHHGLIGVFEAESVYNHPAAYAAPWKWALIHGLFVAAAGAAAIVSWRMNEEARSKAVEASRRAQSSEAADELKSRFVAMASHELRTPLTSISGFAKTMLDREDTLSAEQRRQFVQIIADQSDRLSLLVADLLTVSRIESGQLQPRLESLQLSSILRKTLFELEPAIGNMPVETRCSDAIHVHSDPRHLQQIITNLVTNAVKYGEPPIKVDVELEAGNGPSRTGRFALLRIADHGAGVPAEFTPHMFDRFTQTDVANGRPARGTGLGLSIVKGLAEAQRGDVWYEQNVPQGAAFCLRLPLAPESAG